MTQSRKLSHKITECMQLKTTTRNVKHKAQLNFYKKYNDVNVNVHYKDGNNRDLIMHLHRADSDTIRLYFLV